ncbi:carbohydrate kinase [Candidatus Desantisbacteria bacterium CG02_land_8_20_14_3_00_49_13]|nr:MAG: carbohydrate kinase [Candidatus Desantisbacteria bacterium CG02_land_8_20_14_3_00_49_13]
MSMDHGLILVADIGTTNLKAGVVDAKGRVLSYAEKGITLLSPEKGAAEHDPGEIYSIFRSVCRKAVSGFGKNISAIALSAYQCGFLPVDPKMKPLGRMITLLDTRCEKESEEIKKRFDTGRIYRTTGCPPFFIYALPKILWLKKNKPGVFRKTRYFLGSKDYVIYRLTGKICTEPSLASATQLFDIHKLDWSDYMLSIAGIKKSSLPEVVRGDKVLCGIPEAAGREIGLKREALLIPGVYDGGSVALGLGGFEGGAAVMNLGTTAMLRVSCAKPILDRQMRFQTYYLCAGRWLTGGAINNAGIVLNWLGKNLLGMPYEKMLSLAAKSPAGSDGLVFLPFLAGERDPRIGSSASGAVFGLKLSHNVSHLIRSSLEGVSCSLRLIKEALDEDRVKLKELRIGGGGARSGLWVKIIGEMLDLPARLSKSSQVSLLGGAVIGYTALGRYKSIKEAAGAIVKLEKPPVYPAPGNVRTYDKVFSRFSNLIKGLID